MLNLPNDVPIEGIIGSRLLDGNVLVTFSPIIGGWRVAIANPRFDKPNTVSWDQAYEFDDYHWADALIAFVEYGQNDYEPSGWERHIPSERRRPGGDPAKEYISGV